jgi:starch phosphorylase
MVSVPRIAYFSMEIHLAHDLPTYSGGLGVLAGDMLRAAADLGVPMVGMTLLHRQGHARQHLDARWNQTESYESWDVADRLRPPGPTTRIRLEGRDVKVRAWRHDVVGLRGHVVPVLLLDTDDPENHEAHRGLTDRLYGGDDRYRLAQEVVLGMGGVGIVRELGWPIETYHMNEGHSALLGLTLLEETLRRRDVRDPSPEDHREVRARCVFTTHTPVAAGHDQFGPGLVRSCLGDDLARLLSTGGCCLDGTLNMTYLGLRFAGYVNGVSMRHEEVSRTLFPHECVDAVTNGVHAVTWTSAPFRELFDRHIPDWRQDNLYLRYAVGIPLGEIRDAHRQAKRALLDEVERRTGTRLSANVLTIGFARRAALYKRADLVFTDLGRIRRLAGEVGPLQLIFAGKAHPRDESGKDLIRRVHAAAEALGRDVPVVWLEDYDAALAAQLCAGADLWLSTPQKPLEASGTSGMKAALNGVPSLSVLDGWWIEGHLEGVTGWAIGEGPEVASNGPTESASLYEKLEHVILPMFYDRARAYDRVRRSAIAINGSFFNAQRMLSQYLVNAYTAATNRTRAARTNPDP